MLIFLISCFSFIFFLKSLSFKPIIPPTKSSEWRFLLSPPWFEDFSCFLVSLFKNSRLATSFCLVPSKMPLKKMNLGSWDQESVEEDKISLLDLPELVLDCILEKLTPAELCRMAGVSSCLRERCTSDHLWDKHLKHKWVRLIGDAANREWQRHVASRKRTSLLDQSKGKGLLGFLGGMWPFAWIEPKLENRSKPRTYLPSDSLMSLYLSLENGKFWFPAQVYNRENGHVGFLLSCYDAQVSYDSLTDSFQARYSPHGRRTVEEKITWDRLRPPPVDTPAYGLYFSDCLHDLKPGDHVEIQWRRSSEFPYGWWYAVIGHLESCEGNENHCQCQHSDTVVLEFNQYSPGSRWRQTTINRKEHREEGNEADGFYGGIRKIYKKEEISTWKRLWPNQVFEWA